MAEHELEVKGVLRHWCRFASRTMPRNLSSVKDLFDLSLPMTRARDCSGEGWHPPRTGKLALREGYSL